MLTSLLEAETAPACRVRLQPLQEAADPSPDPSQGGCLASSALAQPRSAFAGAHGGAPRGGPRALDPGQDPTDTPKPARSIVAALAAPELRCRASWFREFVGEGGRPGDVPNPMLDSFGGTTSPSARAALLRSLVAALEVPRPPSCLQDCLGNITSAAHDLVCCC